MANCKNKFLGLDSIDFLKNYIDDKFQKETIATSVITLQIFKYFENSVAYREKPADNIYYDFETGSLKNLSNGWGTLKDVASQLTPDGAIYLSTRIQQGTNGEDIRFTEWSEPIKISGENGSNGRDGVDGKNGNSSNAVVYTPSDSTITIDEYFGANYYISTSGNITYDFKLNDLAFEPGATFKFSNSKANLTFKTEDTMPFLVNGIETTEFNTSNYDCFEIVCVQADKKLLIVIGGKFENYSQN